MIKQSFLQILQYNIRKSLRIQESFLINREVREFNIVTIQKQDCNNNDSQSFSSAHNFFHLVKNSSSQSRTCIYVNKCLRLNQWIVETVESDICLIRILTHNTDDETQTLRLLNVYNSCSLSTTFTERSSIISRLNELLKNDCEQLIIEDFNLHHSHWEEWRCFTRHTMTDTLLNVIINTRLKLLLKSDTITCEAHNQFTTIDLVFSSEKIQFMTCKCKVRIDLHQRLNHLSIITELCLQTISVQLSTQQLWKKMNTEALSAYLRIHLSLKHSLDDKTMMNVKVCKIIRVLQKIIEKSTLLTKSSNWARDFWNQSCFKVVMKSRQLWIIWKTQGTLEAWNEYLKHNDHKNKIIQQTKCAHFRTQMHELSEALKSIWRFAKWARIESQLSKKLSQFSSLKWSDIDHMTTTFEEKIEILREKFFSSSSQANVSDIAESFISLTVSFNSRITEDEVKQTIRRVKADKASNASDISNRVLQASLAELISVLMSLFNACVTHKYHLKQFKKTQTIVLRKLKKSDYIDSKTYRLIALLDIMSKALKSIMIKRLSDIVETHHMLSNAQMRARRKWFMILTLDLLIDQVHTVWDCEIKYVIFMLSLDIVKAFNWVLHIRLLHTLKMKRTSSYIIKWTRSFLKNWETSLIFNEQTSDMREVNADILQRFLISSILFLFFNASLIEKCKALRIKIEVLDFVNNINILVYDRFTEEICRTLSKAYNVCAKWACTHDATFTSEKYELTHFTRKSKRFNMMTSIQIESSVIKSKSNIRVLKMQLNMKLQWNTHLQQIEMNHVTRMLTLSCLEVFTWEAIFTKARQVYSAVVRSEIAFEASVWHQRDKKDELLSKERRLETLQNQTLRHVAEAFKRVNIETLEAETYMSLLHVHLNMLQNKITLHSWVNDQTQEIRQACELIRAHLTKVNRVISCSLVIKKIVLLNVFIQEDVKI